MTFLRRLGLICCCASGLLASTDAHASSSQPDPPRAQATTNAQPAATRRWEIAIHGGGIGGSAPPDGSGRLPDERPPTRVVSVFGDGELTTAPSWFFGEQAARLNASFARFGGFQSLDRVLMSAGARRQGGGHVGIKVSRRMTSRLRAELSIDHRAGRLALTRDTLGSIETSRASFARLFATLPFMISADASATTRAQGSSELVTTGAIAVDLVPRGRSRVQQRSDASPIAERSAPPELRHLHGERRARAGRHHGGTGLALLSHI